MRLEADIFRRLQDADWETIGKKLLVHAHHRAMIYSWRDGSGFELAAGQTLEDIVQEVIYKTCAGERKWDPAKGPLEPWLKDQVNSIMDHLAKSAVHRREAHRLETVSDDGAVDQLRSDSLQYAPPNAARVASAEEIVIKQEEIKEDFTLLLEAADGDKQLEQLILVVWEGCEKASEIAEAMGISAKEGYILIRKLKRRVSRKREQHGAL